ncbi:MAG TPA: thioesterase family protein [Pseudonocardiaceae bacterium]|nr:thioesterase family protein [Pseudonocardiaceae bacterium]
MGVYVAEVRPRWSDMDVFGHVNHASTVTLLEEARIDLLFTEAGRHSAATMAEGIVVARLAVDYHSPLVADGSMVRVEISVRDLRAASFTLDYTVYNGRRNSDAVVATAETLLVPYDVNLGRPRRLTDAERDFLAGYRAGVRSG